MCLASRKSGVIVKTIASLVGSFPARTAFAVALTTPPCSALAGAEADDGLWHPRLRHKGAATALARNERSELDKLAPVALYEPVPEHAAGLREITIDGSTA